METKFFLSFVFIACYTPSVVALVDLHKYSRRKRKFLWALFLITVPILSVVLYDKRKKRSKSKV